uniref:tRNA (guanine(26)-N(2))-dimethyltransferase n=1 Tax=Glossina morsitans morsitans TaxID=37546 RepID=A0A1B0GE85_GLOMM
MIYQCTGCSTFNLQPLGLIKPNPTETRPTQVKFGIPTGPPINTNCEHCGQKHHLGGSIWSDPIHDNAFVQRLIEAINKTPLSELCTQTRLHGMLTMVLEESQDVPLYYSTSRSKLHITYLNSKIKCLGGSIWSDPIHDNAFVQRLIEAINKTPLSELCTQTRLHGMLTMVLEELQDVPLYYSKSRLFHIYLNWDFIATFQNTLFQLIHLAAVVRHQLNSNP